MLKRYWQIREEKKINYVFKGYHRLLREREKRTDAFLT